MSVGEWDYKNFELLPNQIKASIEAIEFLNLSDERERRLAQNILWLWYHHATSCALWRYADKDAARTYSEKALELQSENHPNRIARLFYFLIRDNLQEAEIWAKTIITEPEKTTAKYFLDLYREGRFFDKQV